MKYKVTTQMNKRLISLDVLRGIAIIGMILVLVPGHWGYVYAQLRHAEWQGLTSADVVFPLFLFAVGVSITLSLSKRIKTDIRKQILYGVAKRAVLLFLLGMFVFYDFTHFRIMGVLQRIAICYLIASVTFLYARIRGQVILTVSLLLGYWAVMELLPVAGAGMYAMTANVASSIDKIVLNGYMWTPLYEPEGLISTLPAIATTLIGVLAGQMLRWDASLMRKVQALFLAASCCVITGLLWSVVLPINKNLWTSSFVLVTSGISLSIFGILYYLIELRNIKKVFYPLRIFGQNALVAYIGSGLLDNLLIFLGFKEKLFGILATMGSAELASFAYSFVHLGLLLISLCLLHRKNIFVKI